MPSIEGAVELVMKAGVPVLFVDTCILLDIIRSTDRCLRDYPVRASELLEMITSTPPKCLLILSSIVPHEWRTNARSVTEEVERHLIKMEEQASHFHDACEALGIAAAFGRPSYAGLGLAESLRDLSGRFLDNSICLDPDDESRVRAIKRVITNTPPARKGREVMDCVIIEEYLAVCRSLQAAGFARKRVFSTSNTDDYCEPGKKIHPSLALEFGPVGLSFTKNLAWAVHELTH
jgi:hypothetical protein